MEITFLEYFELQISNQANEAVFRLDEHWWDSLITLILAYQLPYCRKATKFSRLYFVLVIVSLSMCLGGRRLCLYLKAHKFDVEKFLLKNRSLGS